MLLWVQDLPETLSAIGAVKSQWVLDRVASGVLHLQRVRPRARAVRAFVDRVRNRG